MKVRWSRLALADLADALEYLNSRNPVAAAGLERRIASIETRIAQFPYSAQEVAERPGVRRVPLVRYPQLLFYTVHGGEAVILRVLHGAMDKPWERLR